MPRVKAKIQHILASCSRTNENFSGLDCHICEGVNRCEWLSSRIDPAINTYNSLLFRCFDCGLAAPAGYQRFGRVGRTFTRRWHDGCSTCINVRNKEGSRQDEKSDICIATIIAGAGRSGTRTSAG
jgi:hypothetical protein